MRRKAEWLRSVSHATRSIPHDFEISGCPDYKLSVDDATVCAQAAGTMRSVDGVWLGSLGNWRRRSSCSRSETPRVAAPLRPHPTSRSRSRRARVGGGGRVQCRGTSHSIALAARCRFPVATGAAAPDSRGTHPNLEPLAWRASLRFPRHLLEVNGLHRLIPQPVLLSLAQMTRSRGTGGAAPGM
jgi:hypothetical protein